MDDPIALKLQDTEYATEMGIRREFPLIWIGGPPGIGKSRRIKQILGQYSAEKKVEWAKLSDKEKIDLEPRRTMINEKGEILFRPPARLVPGGHRDELQIYGHLWWCSYYGEVGLFDDTPGMIFKRNQEMLNDACDEERAGEVSIGRDTSAYGIPSHFPFNGCAMLVHNMTTREIAQKVFRRIRDRSYFVNFPFDPEIVFRFVFNEAFRQKGLKPFCMAMDNPALGPARGLGLSNNRAEEVLHKAAEFYYVHYEYFEEQSFRALRQLCRIRATTKSDVDFERRARDSLFKKR